MTLSSQISKSKQLKSALERLDDLEIGIPNILSQVNIGFNQVNGRLNESTEILNAISQLFGQDLVTQKVNDNRVKAAEEKAEQQRQGVAKALADGAIIPAEVVGEKTVIVTEVKDKDGNVEPPGRLQMESPQLSPQFKPLFMGKGVGTVIPAPAGGTLTIKELYEFVPAPPEAANTDTQQPTAAAGAGDAPATDAPTSAAEAPVTTTPPAEAAPAAQA